MLAVDGEAALSNHGEDPLVEGGEGLLGPDGCSYTLADLPSKPWRGTGSA